MSGAKIVDLPRAAFVSCEDFQRRFRDPALPIVLTGMARDWPALQQWSFDGLKTLFGDVVVPVHHDLPLEGVPYDADAAAHQGEMTFAAFIDFITSNTCATPSYMAQRPSHAFADLRPFCRFQDITGERDLKRSGLHLWVGTAHTRSGLHADRFDNLFAQIVGRKEVFLAAPDQARHLYVYPDYIQKSRIDPEHLDETAFPKAGKATFFHGMVEPGDVVFIPKLWWHHIHSWDRSVSLNYWFGKSATVPAQLRASLQSPACLFRIGWDFVWLGALKHPYTARMFAEAPTGKFLYDQLIGYRRTRRPRAPRTAASS